MNQVYLLERLVATPLVAFAVTHLGCAAGVMVTASHNPKQDNGSQIVPPTDSNIAACIQSHLQPAPAPAPYLYSDRDVLGSPLARDVTDEVARAYFSALERLSDGKGKDNRESSIRVAYTAMHGVGTQWVKRAIEVFGFSLSNLLVVPLQSDPDPLFPTVVFPNPEEKGALNQAISFANSQVNCNLIIANDPDADRLAIAEKGYF
jgi:phosphomannomutase